MKIVAGIKKFWEFLNEDTWQSWLVSLALLVSVIYFIFFPALSFFTASRLPLVVVESCSMYHEAPFDDWWFRNSAWYESNGITKSQFEKSSLKNGLNKGDIIFVWGRTKPKFGDIIIFDTNPEALSKRPVIHRVVSTEPYETKGDHNPKQLTIDNNIYKIDETSIPQNRIIGKAVFRIPLLGWIKLIFFEPFKPQDERGFCK